MAPSKATQRDHRKQAGAEHRGVQAPLPPAATHTNTYSKRAGIE